MCTWRADVKRVVVLRLILLVVSLGFALDFVPSTSVARAPVLPGECWPVGVTGPLRLCSGGGEDDGAAGAGPFTWWGREKDTLERRAGSQQGPAGVPGCGMRSEAWAAVPVVSEAREAGARGEAGPQAWEPGGPFPGWAFLPALLGVGGIKGICLAVCLDVRK